MSDTPTDATPAADSTANSGVPSAEEPRIFIHTQYLKDISFENPNAPETLKTSETPETNVKIDIQVQKIEGEDHLFEVGLQITAEAKRGGVSLFVAEVLYAAVFTVQVKPEVLRPALMIECPRLIFPFARQILADAVRHGGYPPLLLQPVDFVEIYRQDMAQRREQEQTGTEAGG